MKTAAIKRRTFLFAALGLMTWSLAATLAAAYYNAQYTETRKTFEELKSLVIDVDVLMDYGNATRIRYSKNLIAGSTAFDALLAVTTNVEYKITAYGVFVTSIDGVKNVAVTPTSGRAWLWYYWNGTTWVDLLKASDAYILKPDDSIAWRYESYSYSF